VEKKGKNMKETINTNLDKELSATERLAVSVQKLGELREYTESSANAMGSLEAEEVIVANAPTLSFIVDGSLKSSRNGRTLGSRIALLPPEQIDQTQDQIDLLLNSISVIGNLASARRLEPYLPVVLPKTQAGFKTLRQIAEQYAKAIPIPKESGSGDIPAALRGLTNLDDQLRVAGLKDPAVVDALSASARQQAQVRLEKSKIDSSEQISQIRAEIAEQRIYALKREPVEVPGTRGYSRYEVLANQIIERDGLFTNVDSAREEAEARRERERGAVLNALAKRRAIGTVVSLIDQDPLLCQVLAKRSRLSPEDLLMADQGVKRLAANNALNSNKIILSVEDRRVFYGEKVVEEERAKLTQSLLDPLSFIARATDDELLVIRTGISKISDERSVFELAGERLRKQLEDEVTEEELMEILTHQIIKELLLKRCQMAVDLAIRDLGISSNSLLTNPSALLQSADIIVANALRNLSYDSPPLRLPNVEIEGFNGNNSAYILEIDQLKCITEGNMVDLLEKLAQPPDLYGVRIEQREGVKMYMVDQKARELITRISRFLADLSKISDNLILPETEDEMSCLLAMVVDAITTGRPLTLVTPICPDWSRDSEGKYDFKSLSGGESYIGNKFLTYGVEMLAVFAKHKIPYKGVLQFADWGLETEINAKDTYGRKLSAEDIQMCFQSTIAATDEHLRSLQLDKEVGNLFINYSIVSMKESLESKLNIPEVQAQLEKFLTSDTRGKRLLDTLAEQSYKINLARLGLNRDENRKMSLQNLLEYATEGQSIGPNSILVVCESRTTSRVYNLPRQKHENIPVFFIKGKEGIDKGVNIL